MSRNFPNRKRVDDYYGVHDTGMAPEPDADTATESVPGQSAPVGQVPPPTGASTGENEPGSSKPDPLNDPLNSYTFHGVQPESDTFEAQVSNGFGYSGTTRDPEDSAANPFAPPRFEPRAEPSGGAEPPRPGAATSAADGEFATSFEADIIDVEIVDVAEVGLDDPAQPERTEEPAEPRFRAPLALDAYVYTQIDESYVDPATLPEPKEPGTLTDYNAALNEAMSIDGALGVALVDSQSGMTLATAGNPAGFNLEVAAAGNSGLVQAMGRTMDYMDLEDHIEDILVTLGSQYQIVRPIRRGGDGLFLYLVLDRARANLAMARFRLTKLEETIQV